MMNHQSYGQRFAGKNIVVTGAASGIGLATSLRLAAEGGNVYAFDVNEAGLQVLAEQAQGLSGSVQTTVASVTDRAAVQAIIDRAAAAEGGLHVLVNVAGLLRVQSFDTIDEAALDQLLDVNLKGTFIACQLAMPHLLKTKGNIVNTSSTSALYGHPYMTHYAASKGAVGAFTQSLAWEYLRSGVRVNAVAPGGVTTPLSGSVPQQMVQAGIEADWSLFGHLQRPDGIFGDPEQIAGVIAMLASDDGAFVNGVVLRADGGNHS
ncbi:MAG: SDR family oxidoreductase [Deinococcus sp.]|nr:SDR family oxidoreductase [Deinococcus sp.]